MQAILGNQPKKFLRKLTDKNMHSALLDILQSLESDPLPYAAYDLTKLSSSGNHYRIRKGDFRISYFFDATVQLIYVSEICRREQAYKKL